MVPQDPIIHNESGPNVRKKIKARCLTTLPMFFYLNFEGRSEGLFLYTSYSNARLTEPFFIKFDTNISSLGGTVSLSLFTSRTPR